VSYSGGSKRMQEFWKGYVKPTPAEARRRKATRELNWKRLPWVLHFGKGRPCEARRGCKTPAHWAFTCGPRDAHTPNALILTCTHHLRYIDLYGYRHEHRARDWYREHGWQTLDGVIIPYDAETPEED